MSTPLDPVGNNVVVQEEKAASKTKSGLYLPENAQEKSQAVKVVATGPDVSIVKVGDLVIYRKSYSSSEIKVTTEAREEYIIIQEEDVVAFAKPAQWKGEK